MVLADSFRFGESIFAVLCRSHVAWNAGVGCLEHQAGSTGEAGEPGVGLTGEPWHVKEIVPRLTEFCARLVQKSHFLQSLRSKSNYLWNTHPPIHKSTGFAFIQKLTLASPFQEYTDDFSLSA